MIILDTHIWVWWVNGSARLPAPIQAAIAAHTGTGLGVCAISCWEVAKLVAGGKLQLNQPIEDWLDRALKCPGVRLLALTPQVAVESTRLPRPVHRDPADQIIMATARVHGCAIATMDTQILAYPHVEHV